MDSNNMNGQQQAPQYQQQAPQTAYQQPQYQQAYQNYQQSYQQAYQQPYPQQPVYNNINVSAQIPDNYKPISAWGYIGYMILFSIPVIGLILLIVFSFSDKNINRRNYARSFWCALLLSIIITVILLVITAIAGVSLVGYLDMF